MEKSVLVFGLVSNGKSTLINAFLGKALMPMSNLSCTSMTVKVFDRLEEDMYGKAFYLSDNARIDYDRQDAASSLQHCNDSTECDGEFCIYESLSALNKHKFQLILIDTPGINDAISTKRSDITRRSIFDNKVTTLLYLSHIRTCGTTDEEQCLRSASEIIRSCEENEWFFVVNGWDMKDDEEEFSYIGKIRMLIAKCGLPQPQIFFISALGALICRKALSDDIISSSEKEELEHILRYYRMYERMGRNKGDKSSVKKVIQDALFCTGVPSLEEALYHKLQIYADAEMKDQIDALKNEMDLKSKMIRENMEVISRLSVDVRSLERLYEKSEQQESNILELRKSCDETERELQKTQADLSELAGLQNRMLEEAEKNYNEIKPEIKKIQAGLSEAANCQKRMEKEVESNYYEIKLDTRKIQADLSELSDRQSGMAEDIDKKHNETMLQIHNIQVVLSETADWRSRISAEVNKRGNEIEKLKSITAENEEKRVQLEMQVTNMNEEIVRMQQEFAEKIKVIHRNEKLIAFLALAGLLCGIVFGLF